MAPGKRWVEEFLPPLYREMFADLCTLLDQAPSAKSFQRDLEHLHARGLKEGHTIYTKLLPSMGKAYDRAMETGQYIAPRYTGDLLKGVLALSIREGRWSEPEPSVVRLTRQILYAVYKLELPYTLEQENDVLQTFCATEAELKDCALITLWDADSSLSRVLDIAADLLSSVFSGFDPRAIRPRHGPGAVATGESLEDKWHFKRLYSSIHQSYPYYEYFMVRTRQSLLDQVEWYRTLERVESPTARVVLVPKDSRGPRLISMEPLELQYVQQGYARCIVPWLESHPLTSGHVNFTRQDVNRSLAKESSLHHYYGTLDMKDASDRVSVELVKRIFPVDQVRYLLSLRSDATQLPDGSVIPLAKFAPMGSAICFPIEALCFWSLTVATLIAQGQSRNASISDVYVYGDDIVAPTTHTDRIVEVLEQVGLKVNLDKSFTHGDFRESCGLDAYKGVEVQPIRLKTVWDEANNHDGKQYESYISYRNSFHERSMFRTSAFIEKMITSLYGFVPRWNGLITFPCFVDHHPHLGSLKRRWNAKNSCSEIAVRALTSSRRPVELDGYPRLMRSLTGNVDDDPNMVVLPRCTKLRVRWMKLLASPREA